MKTTNVRYSLIALIFVFLFSFPSYYPMWTWLGIKVSSIWSIGFSLVLALNPCQHHRSNKAATKACRSFWAYLYICLFIYGSFTFQSPSFIVYASRQDNDIAKRSRAVGINADILRQFSQPEATVCHCCGRDLLASFFKYSNTSKGPSSLSGDGICSHRWQEEEPFRLLDKWSPCLAFSEHIGFPRALFHFQDVARSVPVSDFVDQGTSKPPWPDSPAGRVLIDDVSWRRPVIMTVVGVLSKATMVRSFSFAADQATGRHRTPRRRRRWTGVDIRSRCSSSIFVAAILRADFHRPIADRRA